MTSKTVNSTSSYSFSSHGNRRNPLQFHLLPTIKPAKPCSFLKSRAAYGIISPSISRPRSVQVKASASPNNFPSSWQKWLIGLVVAVILPALGYKGGLFSNLKGKIDKAVETVEHVVEEQAEKIVEEVEEKLPDDSKLKEALESFDALAQNAVNEAKKAEDVVNKVKDVEEELEATLIKSSKAQSNK